VHDIGQNLVDIILTIMVMSDQSGSSSLLRRSSSQQLHQLIVLPWSGLAASNRPLSFQPGWHCVPVADPRWCAFDGLASSTKACRVSNKGQVIYGRLMPCSDLALHGLRSQTGRTGRPDRDFSRIPEGLGLWAASLNLQRRAGRQRRPLHGGSPETASSAKAAAEAAEGAVSTRVRLRLTWRNLERSEAVRGSGDFRPLFGQPRAGRSAEFPWLRCSLTRFANALRRPTWRLRKIRNSRRDDYEQMLAEKTETHH